MSRSGYSDDCEYMELYRNAVEQAIRGKRGQKLLTELAAAMDAMPEKKLISGELQANGAYCALGVVGAVRGVDLSKLDPYDAGQVSKKFDIAESLAREVAYINDDDDYWSPSKTETPEYRWARVRKWVAEQLDRGDAKNASSGAVE